MKRTNKATDKILVGFLGDGKQPVFVPLTAGSEGQSAALPKTGWTHSEAFGWQRQAAEDALDNANTGGRLAQPSTRRAAAAVSNSSSKTASAAGIPPKQFLFGHVEGKDGEKMEENLGALGAKRRGGGGLLEAGDAAAKDGQCVIGPISKNLIAG